MKLKGYIDEKAVTIYSSQWLVMVLEFSHHINLGHSSSFGYDFQRHKQEMSQVKLILQNKLNWAMSYWNYFVCSGNFQGWSPFFILTHWILYTHYPAPTTHISQPICSIHPCIPPQINLKQILNMYLLIGRYLSMYLQKTRTWKKQPKCHYQHPIFKNNSVIWETSS